jgi:CDP-diacylglycerol--glycerol-3-phosphate 3-phosphatidyltransferase
MLMKMNLPNKLSVLRLCMVPVFVVIMMASDALWANLVGCALFGAAAFTDMLDGKIARKYNLVTDFGKFLDPLADKFMVIGALLVILYKVMGDGSVNGLFTTVFFWTVMIVIFRELAVTSIRLVVSGSAGIVVAANMLGKIKTCVQIACVVICILERAIYAALANPPAFAEYLPASLVLSVLMLVFTLWSGINYIASYWKYMDPEK